MGTPEQDRQQEASEHETAASSRQVHFEELSNGAEEVIIEFAGKQYRLRKTRNGGLILNR